MMKKWLSFIVTLSLLLTLITACASPSTDPKETTPEDTATSEATSEEESTEADSESDSEEESTTEEPEEEISYVPLVKENQACVTVVYPQSPTSYELTSAKKLVRCIERLCNVTVPMVPDTEAVANGMFEILIGDTSRVESAIVKGKMGESEHAVAMVNGALVIHGRYEGTMAYATDQVVDAICAEGYRDEKLLLPCTFDTVGYAGLLTEELFVYDTVPFAFVRDTGDHAYLIRFENTTLQNFSNYLVHLGEHGFETVDSRALLNNPNNLYTMLTDGERAVTVIYTAQDGNTSVVVEPAATCGYLRFLEADYESQNEEVCEPLMIQVGLHPAGGSKGNGMGYIFRLANGKFVVFDGGWDESLYFKEGQNGRRMYETMKEYAPDPNNIQIAAWLVTHAHTDHIGALHYFVKTYISNGNVTLENIIYNFPSEELVSITKHENSELPAKIANYREMLQTAAATGTNLCKAHPGQSYETAGFQLEILFSYDFLCPAGISNFNNSSVCSHVTVEGQTYVFVGDSATEANVITNRIHGEGLKCDFFQVPHHGYGPNDAAFLAQVQPKWLLWPVAGVGSVPAHLQHFFADGSSVKNIYVSAYQNHVFELPFDGTNVTVIPLEKLPEE
ncbi:MAG: MBL fold metallo-hydrolase [Clostridia bacterium]|nr:MBL fold metallo-hydrolase [Clostridia bacterium]